MNIALIRCQTRLGLQPEVAVLPKNEYRSNKGKDFYEEITVGRSST